MDFADLAFRAAVTICPTLFAIAVCVPLERRFAARPGLRADTFQNVKVWAASFTVQALVLPALGGLTTLAVNAGGGGLITLPSSGWGFLAGLAVYLVAMDLGEYVFHRAQHALPWLWAMHSLHHSDTTYDASTTVRHFWLDPLLKTVTVWLAVGLLFRASPMIVLVYTAITYYNFLTHANVRLGFGKAWWVWNSPQYHRIHHSAAAEHFDVNFASLLPIFDLIAGTYYRPKAGEYPTTGLDTGEEPRSFGEAVTWPLRKLWPRSSPGSRKARLQAG
jgi:sterol desaturase/sphingolipid hydroxylase (fatty acid hydroxylase superfamily)